MLSGIVLRLAASVYVSVAAFDTVATYNGAQSQNVDAAGARENNHHRMGQSLMPAILLPLKGGGSRKDDRLRAWSSWAANIVSSHRTPPALWVICTETAVAASVLQLPHVQPFLVSEASSWAAALDIFLSNIPRLPGVGLLGEGVLPHPDLLDSIESIQRAIFEASPPTAIVTRSRAEGDAPGEERWLPDTFVSQLWCNRAALGTPLLTKAGLDIKSVSDTILLEVLQRIVRDATKKKMALVDGTHVIGSIFDASPATVKSNDKVSTFLTKRLEYPRHDADDGDQLYIGGSEFALVYASGDTDARVLRGKGRHAANNVGKTSTIARAPWPPEYVLETVAMNTTSAMSKGLVLVSNVNCGYLDMATNFLLSVRKTSEAKVLFVAMDKVAFDFMDALDPGRTALFPSAKTERQPSLKAGRIGDSNFAEIVVPRPEILHAILRQKYAALWSDSDMVWLKNPLPLLPQLDDAEGAEVMLQYDGNTANKCTCFMFLKPTMMCRILLRLWEQTIVEGHKVINQGALQQPLELMQNAGLRVDFLSPEVMPAGKQFFDHEYEENYVQLYHNHTRIVHNNWIKGRKDKTERFRGYNLWFVENMQFPSCGKYRATLDRLKNMVIFNNDIRMEIWATGAFVLSAIIVVWYFSAYLHVFGRRGPNV